MRISILVILPLFWKGITCQLAGYSIRVSPDVGVQEGLCVTIPCTFIADSRKTFSNSTGYWIQIWKKEPLSPYYIVATNNKSSKVQKSNFHLTGNPDTGDCTLTITDARKEDEETYYYRFEESKESKVKYGYNKEATTAITVTDLTEEPVISDLGTVNAGINKTLTCFPPRNCSPTSLNFQWKKSDVADVWMKNSSTVTFTPSLNDHQKNITCEVTSSKGNTTRKNVLLDVCCPTIIGITWDIVGGKKKNKTENIVRTEEGASVILKCLVESNLTLHIIWTNEKSDNLQNGTGKYLELELNSMTTNHSGVYTCSVMTDYVIKSTNINVTVQYPPRNMEITIQSSKGEKLPANQSVIINQTESLSLVCNVDGNPPASVVWVKGEVEVETNKSASSAIINVTSSIIDVYRCLAWNAFGLKEQRIQVGIKHNITSLKPDISHSPYLGIALAFLCGLGISILIILVYKLITRKKWRKGKSYKRAKEPSASQELPENEIYMNVSNTEHKAEESADASAQLDPSGVTSDDELHYSTIAFTAKPSKVPPSQPETEYAEINVK
ncbi:sialic acid-binding Ig-like lectin 13 isoform X2 [Phyllobates terribilis]|uniref:sialic acid-binding Ig-like lectin 13 isoform X2 n=1 Tax=Phyllobates terribilis TaxID=111132 RepID=UPI003CCB3968